MNNETTMTWSRVSAKAKDKVILENCSGYCQPGEMLAIMGPSGAGKTTLLSILAAKKSTSITVTGEVSINITQVKANRWTFNESQFYKFASFVFQNDILYETLTVKGIIKNDLETL